MTEHDHCDERRESDFLGMQMRQQIIATERDEGSETGRHGGGWTHGKTKASPRAQDSLANKNNTASLKPWVLDASTWL